MSYTVYIVRTEGDAVKFGYAQDMDARLSSMQVNNHEQLEIAYTMQVDSKETALALESLLKRRYHGINIRGEWFAGDVDKIISDIRFAFTIANIIQKGRVVGLNREFPDLSERDDLYIDAVDLVHKMGAASIQMFQRQFKIGYRRAAALFGQLESDKVFTHLERQATGNYR